MWCLMRATSKNSIFALTQGWRGSPSSRGRGKEAKPRGPTCPYKGRKEADDERNPLKLLSVEVLNVYLLNAVAFPEAMLTDHRRNDPIMVLEGLVHGARVLDYCRFVRIDGFGKLPSP